jgi:hypothetical protein
MHIKFYIGNLYAGQFDLPFYLKYQPGHQNIIIL